MSLTRRLLGSSPVNALSQKGIRNVRARTVVASGGVRYEDRPREPVVAADGPTCALTRMGGGKGGGRTGGARTARGGCQTTFRVSRDGVHSGSAPYVHHNLVAFAPALDMLWKIARKTTPCHRRLDWARRTRTSNGPGAMSPSSVALRS